MKKCLIILKNLQNEERINYQDYDCFIGVELGASFLLKKNNLKNRHYISDFDSINKNDFLKIKEEENTIFLNKIREFVDTEEAIKYAQSLGYFKDKIVIFLNEDLGRKDHLFNVFNLARKYQVLIYGNKFKITAVPENEYKVIKKDFYKYLSIFLFEKTFIDTKGLKWNLSWKEFNLDEATNLISNEIIKNECKIKTSKLSLVVQAND
ncbi:MAG: hypothetical protein HPAVJP_4200 [Candidatus Hepatoplasma vulgare]|nr:MAG: hypothetical protein HPAVJP_4200 [Candidatus Hepatoplasma sp.]